MIDLTASLDQPAVTWRSAYRPPEWLVPDIALEFNLDPAATRVRATLEVVRNATASTAIRLDSGGQRPLSLLLNLGEQPQPIPEGAKVLAQVSGADMLDATGPAEPGTVPAHGAAVIGDPARCSA